MAASRHASSFAAQNMLRSPSTYVCKNCRRRVQLLSQLIKSQQRPASNQNIPFTEKLRRRIWGTDNPPGLKDPYGGPSFLERRKLRAEEQKRSEEQRAELEAAEQALDKEIAAEKEGKGAQEERGLKQDELERLAEEERPQHLARPSVIGLDDLQPRIVPQEEYQPAETWDGLRHIGHRGHWRDLPPRPQDEYLPWLDPSEKRILSREQLIAQLRLSIVDCLQERVEGADLQNPVIVRNQNGYISHVEDGPVPSDIADASSSHVDDDFLSARFDFSDPITFKIFLRFQKTTGIRLSDPFLNSLANPTFEHTISSVVEHMIAEQRPKPRTTYEELLRNEELTSQPNVVLLPRRETPVDKEKSVGRWKVIERELKNRGLPVLGRVDVNA